LLSSLAQCIRRSKAGDLEKFRDVLKSISPQLSSDSSGQSSTVGAAYSSEGTQPSIPTLNNAAPAPQQVSLHAVTDAPRRSPSPAAEKLTAAAKEHFSTQPNGDKRFKVVEDFIQSWDSLDVGAWEKALSQEAASYAEHRHGDPLQRVAALYKDALLQDQRRDSLLRRLSVLRHEALRRLIHQDLRKTLFLRRLLHLYYAFEVDEIARSVEKGKRLTGAFKLIADACRIPVKNVSQDYSYSKNYKRLLKKGGSGSFCLLGDQVDTL
jgi:hypothetical protein